MSLLNKLVVTALPIIPKAVVGQVAKRYIAGTTLPDAVRMVKSLNERSMMATMDLLGEDITQISEAAEVHAGIRGMFDTIRDNRLQSNVSVKPTQLGLKLDPEACYQRIREIVVQARDQANFVRIDMEDATTTDLTLDMYRRFRKEGFTNLGIVIQAYLRRSQADVATLLKDGLNVRLCKGIYNESPAIAFKDREEIRENYKALLRMLLDGGAYVGIATHDDVLIDHAIDELKKRSMRTDQYEFQMLLGVRENRRDQLVAAGHRLRVYVPYGEQWYAYSTRRLKENPHMAWYITKALFVR